MTLDSNSVDLKDLVTNSFFLSGKSYDHSNIHAQLFPEYGQLGYLRLRSMEEAYSIYNYLDLKKN